MLDAAALHASLLTLDTHIDIPWPASPDPFEDSPPGRLGDGVSRVVDFRAELTQSVEDT